MRSILARAVTLETLLATLLAVVCAALGARDAQAQFCSDTNPCSPPSIQIQISTSVTTSTTLLTVVASDDGTLNLSTLQVWYNGTLLTGWPTTTDNPGYLYTSITASGSISLTSGTHPVIARICDTGTGSSCSADTVQVTYSPPPPPPSQDSAVVVLAQRTDERLIDDCASCASFTTSYSTPAYFMNGGGVSASLRYSSELAKPTGYVEVDAKVTATTVPTRLSIRLRAAGGSYVMLSNGATEAFVLGDTAAVRLAAQFEADSLLTGAYTYDVIVTAYYGPTSAPTAVLSRTLTGVRVLVQNELKSKYGRGWTVVGDVRLHLQSNGGVLLADGAGGLAYFALGSCGGSPWTCSYTSPIGDYTTLVRKVKSGTDTVWTRTGRTGDVSEWANSGLLRSTTDRWGNAVEIERMTSGDPALIYRVKVSTAVGGTSIDKYTTFSYNGTTGKLSGLTLPDGRQVAVSINSGTFGALSSITDPDGRVALSPTESGGRIVTLAGRDTAISTIVYDAYGQLANLISPQAVIDSGTVARDTTVIFSQRRQLLEYQAQAVSATAPAARLRDSTFIRMIDAKGTASSVWSHASGAPSRTLTRTASGQSESVSFTYNYFHRVERVKQNSQAGVEYSWSAVGGMLVSEQDLGSGLLTEYYYTNYDQVDSVRVGGKLQVRYYYSGSRLAPDSVRTDSTAVTRFTYDSRGRVLTVKDPSNATTTSTYETTHANASSLVRTASGVSTASTSTSYDGSGRPISVTDPLGRTFTTQYDSLNRVRLTTGPSNTSTEFKFDDAALRDTVIDAIGQKYVTQRNSRGWTVAQVDPRGKVDSLFYDRLGRLTRFRNRRADVVRVTYDGLGRVLTRLATLAADGSVDTTTFSYDPSKRWIASANRESIDTVLVDQSGRPTLNTTVRSGRIFRTAYGYTGGTLNDQIVIRRDSATATIWADTIAMGFNSARRSLQVMDFGNKFTTTVLDAQGRPTVDSLPTSTTPANKLRKTTTYSAASQILSETFSGGANNALSRTYGDYDAIDRIGSITRAGSPAPLVRMHEYDALGRLTKYLDTQTWSWTEYFQIPNDPYGDCPGCFILDSLVHTEVDTINTSTYSYDKVANRTDLGAVIDTANRMRGMHGDSIFYDDAGFMTRRRNVAAGDTSHYWWNALGQLVKVARPGYVVTYGYDGFGNRVRRTVNGDSTRYLVESSRVLAELNSSWSPTVKYSYYPGVDRPHAIVRDGKRYYFAQDLQGNVTGLVDSIGNAVTTYFYTPYGEALPDAGDPVGNPYRYKGREWDAQAGLYFMRARYYDPRLGRFISEDPIGLDGGVNPTAFVESEPVNQSDPSGLLCQLQMVDWAYTDSGLYLGGHWGLRCGGEVWGGTPRPDWGGIPRAGDGGDPNRQLGALDPSPPAPVQACTPDVRQFLSLPGIAAARSAVWWSGERSRDNPANRHPSRQAWEYHIWANAVSVNARSLHTNESTESVVPGSTGRAFPVGVHNHGTLRAAQRPSWPTPWGLGDTGLADRDNHLGVVQSRDSAFLVVPDRGVFGCAMRPPAP